jgi:aryl-alcohol dehydrogenase-like predicted oxidoreductase
VLVHRRAILHGRRADGWGEVDEVQSIRALHLAREPGARLFDTAHAYGTGPSEGVLGRGFADRRGDVVIATRFGYVHNGRRGS